MKKIKFLALVLCIAILLPVFTSCKAGTSAGNVVKEDDPWYECTKFELDKNIQESDDIQASSLCVSDDRIFNIYVKFHGWASIKTFLDSYDYDGNLLNRQEITSNELDEFCIMTIYSFGLDGDGTTMHLIAYINASGKHGPVFADLDPETGLVSNIKDVFDKEAEKVRRPGSAFARIETIGEYTLAVLDCGSGAETDYQFILFKNTEYVCELDTSSIKLIHSLEGFSVDETKNSLYMSGFIPRDNINMEFDLNNGKLKSQKSFNDIDAQSVNIAEYTMTDNGEMCKIDSLGNIVKIDYNTMTPKTVIDTNWYTPYFYDIQNEKYSVFSTVLNCTEDRAVILDGEVISYGCLEYIDHEYVRVLKKADKNPHAGKKIVELALPVNSGVTDYLAKAIFEFNKTDNEYLIRVWDKYKTGFVMGRTALASGDKNEQQVYKMIQDLKGDQAPDLAIGIQKNYAMRDEVFMDLTGFLEPEIMEKQYGNIIEAGRIGGKLYFLPVTLEIEGLVTKTDMVRDGAVGITFEEYDKLIKDEMKGFSPYDYPNSTYYNKKAFILSCIDTKSAIEGDKIEFGTEQFRTAAEYAKENFNYDDLDSTPEDYLNDWNRYRGKCYYAKINDYLDFVQDCYNSQDHYSIIGTPSADAAGPRFVARETISVSATTDVKDGCKKFINFLFAGTAFNTGDCSFRHIVTNKEIMDKNIDTLARLHNEAFNDYQEKVKNGTFMPAAGLDKAYGYKEATADMRESFKNSLSSISTYYYEDYTIVQFVFEELAPYYAGDRSFDDAVRILNDRTAKYVKEM